jgi:MFS family permease
MVYCAKQTGDNPLGFSRTMAMRWLAKPQAVQRNKISLTPRQLSPKLALTGAELASVGDVHSGSSATRDGSDIVIANELPHSERRPARFITEVGAVIGLSILGDSLMYSLLPLEAASLGISLPLVGILLSANRLVRLFSNSWASVLFARLGPRRPFWAATIAGLFATMLYGVGWGFVVFLAARLLWGIAWSGLRQGGYEAIWSGSLSTRGRLTGLLWGLVRLGSAISVLVGGWLYDLYGYEAAVAVITMATVPAVVLAGLLQWPQSETIPPSTEVRTETADVSSPAGVWAGWRMALGEAWLRWLVSAGFLGHLLNGIVLSSTSVYLADRLTDDGQLAALGVGVGALAGLMLGTRWLSDMVLGPVFGYLSDRFGRSNTAALLVVILFVALVGLAWLPLFLAMAALLIVFICDGGIYVVLAALASDWATETAQPHTFVGVYTTGGDAGSALGPLLAFSLGTLVGLPVLYTSAGLLLAFAIFRYRHLASQMSKRSGKKS